MGCAGMWNGEGAVESRVLRLFGQTLRTERVQSFIDLIIEEHACTGRERFAERETEVDETMAVSRHVALTSELQRLRSGSRVRLTDTASDMDSRFVLRWRA